MQSNCAYLSIQTILMEQQHGRRASENSDSGPQKLPRLSWKCDPQVSDIKLERGWVFLLAPFCALSRSIIRSQKPLITRLHTLRETSQSVFLLEKTEVPFRSTLGGRKKIDKIFLLTKLTDYCTLFLYPVFHLQDWIIKKKGVIVRCNTVFELLE